MDSPLTPVIFPVEQGWPTRTCHTARCSATATAYVEQYGTTRPRCADHTPAVKR